MRALRGGVILKVAGIRVGIKLELFWIDANNDNSGTGRSSGIYIRRLGDLYSVARSVHMNSATPQLHPQHSATPPIRDEWLFQD